MHLMPVIDAHLNAYPVDFFSLNQADDTWE